MEHGIATHMNYTCKIYSMTSENGMSYCVCQIHVLGVQCMVVISTTNCNVVLAHTLFLFLAPEMQGIFAIRVTIICMQLSDNFLHFTAMHAY